MREIFVDSFFGRLEGALMFGEDLSLGVEARVFGWCVWRLLDREA
jgi:hypothetical protein